MFCFVSSSSVCPRLKPPPLLSFPINAPLIKKGPFLHWIYPHGVEVRILFFFAVLFENLKAFLDQASLSVKLKVAFVQVKKPIWELAYKVISMVQLVSMLPANEMEVCSLLLFYFVHAQWFHGACELVLGSLGSRPLSSCAAIGKRWERSGTHG